MFHELVSDHSRHNFELSQTQSLFQRLLDLNNQLFIALLLFVGAVRVMLVNGSLRRRRPGRLFVHGRPVLCPDHLARLAIQSCPDGHGRRRTGLQRARSARRTARRGRCRRPADRGGPDRVLRRIVLLRSRPTRLASTRISWPRPGESIALVGHTGSGKTSILNLIAKFYLPDSGRILIDGRDLGFDQIAIARAASGNRLAAELFVQRHGCRKYPLRPARG